MTDIHSHILWRMDDGAENPATAVEMCSIAEKDGVDTVILTPHLMYWENAGELYDVRESKISRLKDYLFENNINLNLGAGFEILCDDDIFNVKFFNPYTLCGSRYILIEFDFYKTTEEDVTSWCDYLLSFGLVPIIAHPERYMFMLSDLNAAERLSKKGVLFQINCGSAISLFGERESIAAIRLINSGYADFIASDAHNASTRTTDLSRMIRAYPKAVDMDAVRRAVEINPEYILKDEQLFTFYRKTGGF